eukprot:TRINITY_DN81739_c0_g1_i1.p1 TRINITY_DN81739_c0_g1~~TRINITY_DN81739_c0_g1_i1.p1  ORF type:complete len:500 (-),score=169.70 TRINITY_DN81739_c0_g1_i1:64-1488(-)
MQSHIGLGPQASAFARHVQHPEEEHSLARLAGLPTTAWPTRAAKTVNFDLQPQQEHAVAMDRAKKAHFESLLASLADLDEDALYAGIVEAEKVISSRSRSYEEADSTLRAEIGKLSMEVGTMEMQIVQLKAEDQSRRNDEGQRLTPEFELESVKRRLAAVRRGVKATHFCAEQELRKQARLQSARHEREKLESETLQWQQAWQGAIQELNERATAVESLKARHEALSRDTAARGKAKTTKNYAAIELDENEKELRQLMDQQQTLVQNLQDSRNALQLKKLIDEEKRETVDGAKDPTSALIEEIALLEEASDIVEQRSQRAVEEIRLSLELAGSKEMELQRTKAQADEWLKSIWSTICQQKREQLLLHQRIKEEDLWTSHLQKRTDALVQELTTLEDDVRGAFDEWGEPMPDEEKIEQEMWEDLQVLRDRRRGAQHRLAWYLSQRKPLQKALASCKAQGRELQVQLEPIRGLLNA